MSEALVYLLLAILALVAIIVHALNIVVVLHWQGLLVLTGIIVLGFAIGLTVLYLKIRKS